jgi:hypothetical protein
MVPPTPGTEPVSPAEGLIFELLRELELPGWTYCFHSVNLPKHLFKRACEIDFLLLGERGLLSLEVKGGGVSCTDGVWKTRTGKGSEFSLSESPFQQAHSARTALEDKLRGELGSETVRRTVFGHGVIFPDVDFNVGGIEWDPEMVVDRAALHGGALQGVLDRLGGYWERKDPVRKPLSEVDVEAYRAAVRPRFELVPSLRYSGRAIERQLRTLTEQQYRVLDDCARNDRLIIDGGAGTGKTMLAAELARRSKADGSRVLVACHSIVLTGFLRRQPGIEAREVVQFDQIEDLDPGSVDLLIVDEAQDVINEQDLHLADQVLSGGLVDGRWVMLLDSNNQRGLVGSYEKASMDRLVKEIRAASRTLQDNCRNTTEIVKETQDRTDADLGVTAAGHGEPVQLITGTPAEVAEAVADVLSLLDSEESLSDVVLLSPFELRSSLFHSLPGEWRRRIDRLDLMQPGKLERGRIGFAHIADFKGLESRYVILETSPEEDPHLARRLLYVGMTRARAGLWLVDGADPAKGQPR